jgi:hypothetical protein
MTDAFRRLASVLISATLLTGGPSQADTIAG